MNAVARNFQVPFIEVVKSHPGANTADAYRSLIRFALNHKLEPVTDMDFESIPRVSVFFPPALSALISQIAEKNELTFQGAAAGLAQAGANQIAVKNVTGTIATDKDTPFSARPEQATFYNSLIKGLDASKIVVAEASTGVGKGRALMAAAIKAAQDKKAPVIVAAPTVIVVNQLWGELQELRKGSNLGNNVSATILPGATEFADDIKLLEWLNDDTKTEEDEAVAGWIRNGAPHTADDAIGQVASEQGITLAWLMSDLHQIASNLPVEDYVLKTDRSDKTTNSESRALLAEIRNAANRKATGKENTPNQDQIVHAGADIIICTHAMLALGQKTKWAVLPKPKVLIIDEAHLLEETISRMNSHQISLFAISYRLARFCKTNKAKKGSIPSNTLAKAKSLLSSCQKLSRDDSRIKLNDNEENFEFVRKGLSELADAVRSKAFSTDVSIRNDMHATLSNASIMMKNLKGNSAHLQFTPDKRYPLISVGAETIAREAGALWKSAEGGAVLASATMYITDEYGEQKCDYVVRNLSIPLSRLDTPLPVIAEYIYTLPVLHLPNPSVQNLLSRPDAQSRKIIGAEDEWLKALADQISLITKESEGGTLVLTNSYNQIKGISQRLKEKHHNLIDRIVEQTRGVKFSKTIADYKTLHKAGRHPILLGLGPSWTGLNLLDENESAPKDTLLTNLVIACCPVGLNQTPTMQKRIEITNTSAISKEALLTFKQGLGRLIRRNEVKNRHIWVLDGRIWSTTWLRQFTGPAKRLLSKYKSVQFFD